MIVRLLCLKFPYLEQKFQIIQRLNKIETNISSSSEEIESDEDESGSLKFTKSLHKLSNLHEFESEQRQNWKRSEEKEQTEKRKRLLSIS